MEIKETTTYDNFVGKRATEYEPNDLSKFIEIEDVTETEEKEWKKHWVGMPEFVQEDNPPYKRLIVSFRSQEDYEEFAKLLDQNLTEKTKSIWYPKLDRDENSLKRWFEM